MESSAGRVGFCAGYQLQGRDSLQCAEQRHDRMRPSLGWGFEVGWRIIFNAYHRVKIIVWQADGGRVVSMTDVVDREESPRVFGKHFSAQADYVRTWYDGVKYITSGYLKNGGSSYLCIHILYILVGPRLLMDAFGYRGLAGSTQYQYCSKMVHTLLACSILQHSLVGCLHTQ